MAERSKATGLVCMNREKQRGTECLSSGGRVTGGVSEGPAGPRTKQELKGSRLTEVTGGEQHLTALGAVHIRKWTRFT